MDQTGVGTRELRAARTRARSGAVAQHEGLGLAERDWLLAIDGQTVLRPVEEYIHMVLLVRRPQVPKGCCWPLFGLRDWKARHPGQGRRRKEQEEGSLDSQHCGGARPGSSLHLRGHANTLSPRHLGTVDQSALALSPLRALPGRRGTRPARGWHRCARRTGSIEEWCASRSGSRAGRLKAAQAVTYQWRNGPFRSMVAWTVADFA